MNRVHFAFALFVAALTGGAAMSQPLVVEMPARDVLCHPVAGDLTKAETWQQAAQQSIERIRTSGASRVGLLLPHAAGEVAVDAAIPNPEFCVGLLAPMQAPTPFVARTLPAAMGLAMICKDDAGSLNACGDAAKAALPAGSRFADLPRKLTLPETIETADQVTDALFSSAVEVTFSIAEAKLVVENISSHELTSKMPKLRPFVTNDAADTAAAAPPPPPARSVLVFFPIDKKPAPAPPAQPASGR